MIIDDAEPRPQRGALLGQLAREDLDLYSVEECQDRITLLETEIARVKAAMESKAARKSAAEALFNFGS
ncbi:DUF1192 domain-containing protein [Brevundimonas sp.]|jgi:uncharacterized small protein (DUF1192 family)|uniref:DUF1192 domain-containing protein n=1 Tax=Brevundimonas sp. TaxID=1871086 RepID=UPI003510FFCC